MSFVTTIAKKIDSYEKQARRALRRRRAQQVLARMEAPYRVNIGCGKVPFAGWVNLDLDPDPAVDVVWDVTDGLPFPDDSCSFVYNEHFMEHLPLKQAIRFMRETRRILRPGGVLRIAMPNVAESVRCYYENTWREQPWLEKYGYTHIATRAEYINTAFREWGHQWLYDDEELTRRMREAGFEQVRPAAWGGSEHGELQDRETRLESRTIAEATK